MSPGPHTFSVPSPACLIQIATGGFFHAVLMMVFVPLGLVAGLCSWPSVVVFILNALAIVPLTGGLTFAMEGITSQLGERVGSCLNAALEGTGNILVRRVDLPFSVKTHKEDSNTHFSQIHVATTYRPLLPRERHRQIIHHRSHGVQSHSSDGLVLLPRRRL